MRWILLLLLLISLSAQAQITTSGQVSYTGTFEIGTNSVFGGIQSMTKPGGIVTGGGLVGAWLLPGGLVEGDTPGFAGTVFDLTPNHFNLTAVVTGITNQAPYGLAGTNQIGQVGIPSMNFSSNSSLGIARLENINGLAPLFNIPNTGIPTNGGITMVALTRSRMLGTMWEMGIGGNGGSGNANQMGFVGHQASASQTKVNISSGTNSTGSFVTGGMNSAQTNRWHIELFSYDGTTITRMDNMNNSAQTTQTFGTNFTFQSFCVGVRKSTSYANRFNGDWAGALAFTNSMSDGTSRTNVINWLNQFYHFY